MQVIYGRLCRTKYAVYVMYTAFFVSRMKFAGVVRRTSASASNIKTMEALKMTFKFFYLRVIPVLMILLTIISFVKPDMLEFFDEQSILVMRIVALAIVGGIIVQQILFYRCKKCKKWFAMRKGYHEHIGQDVETRRDETGEKRLTHDGSITEIQYTDVNYTRDVYKVTYTCKYCGYRKYKNKVGKFRKA